MACIKNLILPAILAAFLLIGYLLGSAAARWVLTVSESLGGLH